MGHGVGTPDHRGTDRDLHRLQHQPVIPEDSLEDLQKLITLLPDPDPQEKRGIIPFIRKYNDMKYQQEQEAKKRGG